MKSFLDGKKVLPLEGLRPPLSPATPVVVRRTCTANPAEDADASVAVEVVKEGEKVVRLIVTCRCGERTEIECLYPAGS